jgi:antitoxin component of MazEF toxin-antitoxin module
MIALRLSRFGNSRGVRIPKAALDQLGIVDDLTMEIRDTEIVLRKPAALKRDAREGWAEQLDAMIARGEPIDTVEPPIPGANHFDHAEWEW